MRLGILISGPGVEFRSDRQQHRAKETGRRDCHRHQQPRERAGARYRPRTRHFPLRVIASRQGWNVDAADKLLIEELQTHQVDLVCLAGFMRLLSANVIRAFPNRVLNIHPSLLPAFTGLDAQRQALEYGVRITGCTVHFVDEFLDSGPIVIQSAVPVLEGDTVESLSARILVQEHLIYPKAIGYIADGRISVEGRRVSIREEE